MEEAEHYNYLPLEEPDSFRLILLQPSHDLLADVECSLCHITLEQMKEDIIDHFTALSYAWGDPSDTDSIVLDRRIVSVTTSLKSALRHLRDDKRVLRLWADALCINQFDVKERNQQVMMMDEIYKLADHTVIFLGWSNKDNAADATFRTCRAISKSWDHLSVSEKKSFKNDVYATLSRAKGVRMTTEGYHGSVSGLITQIGDAVLTRSWWTRIWVLQELVFSLDPWLQCGYSRIRWSEFCVAINHLTYAYELDYQADALQSKMATMQMMDDVRSIYRSRSSIERQLSSSSILQLIDSRRGLGVSDPRDMIYAHIGLVPASKSSTRELWREVDYNKSLSQVYGEMAEYFAPGYNEAKPPGEHRTPGYSGNILEQSSSNKGTVYSVLYPFEVLSMVDNIEIEHRRRDTPSWTPDWTSTNSLFPNTIFQHSKDEGCSEFWQFSSGLYYHNVIFMPDIGKMCCRGFKIDTVRQISAEFKASDIRTSIAAANIKPAEHPPGTNATLEDSNMKFFMKPGLKVPTRSVMTWPDRNAIYSHLRTLFGPKLLSEFDYNTNHPLMFKQGLPFAVQYVLDHLMWEYTHAWRATTSTVFAAKNRLCRLRSGSLALLPFHARDDDVVVCFRDCLVSFVLRPIDDSPSRKGVESEIWLRHEADPQFGRDTAEEETAVVIGHYQFVGECFIEGLMYGEAKKKISEYDDDRREGSAKGTEKWADELGEHNWFVLH